METSDMGYRKFITGRGYSGKTDLAVKPGVPRFRYYDSTGHAETCPPAQRLFRIPYGTPGTGWVEDIDEKESASDETERDTPILCRQCMFVITHPDQQIAVNGAHRHSFANPSGVVFDIGCFQSAQGCVQAGPSSTEFSWFRGFSWQVSYCRSCITHLGWDFTSTGANHFYGLIVDHLAFPR